MEGKVAIVTGGASGIGEAVSKLFAAHSCRVLLVDKNEEGLRDVAEEIEQEGGECGWVHADVTQEDEVIRFFNQVRDEWGRLDLLVNSAGRDSLSPPITEVTLEEWYDTIEPNMTAVFLTCREAFKMMEEQENGGRIINMGSSSSKMVSGPGHSPYRASKHGMMGLSKNLLREGQDKDIGVTVINPSHVKTPMTAIIDEGLYDEDKPAYLEGWLDEKEKEEGVHASSIDVENVAELTLYVATRPPEVAVPQLSLYPAHKIHRYGMNV